ncbi:hypothetical protein BTR14_22680 [Rhizobium rhizosphaerae]|uniref:Transposase n=1 Tax=Xaviernesmea rhizosphaerae TaxID=1672749 RepID=A0ABX3P7R0_9HYPH|nr:hypothetical protein BTR14_22680 [Xaviernesmea rhizosphaerae]
MKPDSPAEFQCFATFLLDELTILLMSGRSMRLLVQDKASEGGQGLSAPAFPDRRNLQARAFAADTVP